MMGLYGLYKPKKSWGGCLHSLLVYDASKLSNVYVLCSKITSSRPSEGFFFRKGRIFFKSENLKKWL